MKALILTALATALLVFAGTANAQTTTVRIGNLAMPDKLLTASPTGAVGMRAPDAPGQVWTKTGVAPGFVALGALDLCLTARTETAVTMEPCIGVRSQMWRTDADGMIYNRAHGGALEAGARVQLGPVTGLKNQRWVQKAA
jgi:hypothetical protein